MAWKTDQKSVLEDVKRLKKISLEEMGKPIKKTKVSILNYLKEKSYLTLEDACTFANEHKIDPCSFFVQEAEEQSLEKVP